MSNDWPPKRLRFSKEEVRQERTWTPKPLEPPRVPLFQRTYDSDLPPDAGWMA